MRLPRGHNGRHFVNCQPLASSLLLPVSFSLIDLEEFIKRSCGAETAERSLRPSAGGTKQQFTG